MKVTIEISDPVELEKVVTAFKRLDIDNIHIVSKRVLPKITKGNKKLDPKSLFGLWQAKPRNLEEIRSETWQRNRKP